MVDFKIYALTDNFMRIRYIGLTSKDLKHRLKQHMNDFRHNKHKVNWIKKYGNTITAFIIEDKIKTISEAKKREVYYIKTLKSVDDFLGSCVHDPRQLSDKTLLDQMAKCYTGFKFFENAFGIEYDNDHGIDRVNHVFDILHTLIRTKKIEKLHERCQQDIEQNYDSITKLYPIMKKLSLQNMKYFDAASWTEKR